MKKMLHYEVDGKPVDKEVNYIPVRFILAIIFAVLETAAVIAAVMVCSYYIPYFYLLVWATEIAVVIKIIAYGTGNCRQGRLQNRQCRP